MQFEKNEVELDVAFTIVRFFISDKSKEISTGESFIFSAKVSIVESVISPTTFIVQSSESKDKFKYFAVYFVTVIPDFHFAYKTVSLFTKIYIYRIN